MMVFWSPQFSEGVDVDPLSLIPEPTVDFTGEERWGQTFDLLELHQEFVNARFGRQCDYTSYVQDLADFSSIPRSAKTSPAYREYLKRLVSYLEGFYSRTQPLVNAGMCPSPAPLPCFTSCLSAPLIASPNHGRNPSAATPCRV